MTSAVLPDNTLTPERVERVGLKPGQAGTDATIDAMARAALGVYGAGSGRIRELAVTIVRDADVPERDKRGEVVAIHEWVKGHLRYISDPTWYEFVTYPETLAFARPDGDCDDHAVLEAALLGAIGLPTRFLTFSFRNNPAPSHVALQVLVPPPVGASASKTPAAWMTLDPIVKDQPAGWEAPDATGRTVYGVNTPTGYSRSPGSKLVKVLGTVIVLVFIAAKFSRSLKSWSA